MIPRSRRLALPSLQFVFAAILLWNSYTWNIEWAKTTMGSGPPRSAPAFVLLTAINAPLGLAHALWTTYLMPSTLTGEDSLSVSPGLLLNDSLLLAVIWAWWSWISQNLESWRITKTVTSFSWPPLRIIWAMALMLVGLFWGVSAVDVVFGTRFSPWSAAVEGLLPPYDSWPKLLWVFLIAGLHLSWCLALSGFFWVEVVRRSTNRRPPIS